MSARMLARSLAAIALLGCSAAAMAAGADLGQAEKQPTNWTAIGMFAIFVVGTLFITKWAAAKTKSAADFYTAGGGITGFQNGLAIAGDYMSAASFLGISAAVMVGGFDGLIYSIGFLVGWPVVTFLLAERLRNLGKFTFADVAAFRFSQTPVRVFAASGTLVVVAFYLIAQMVGAGQLIKLLFGLEYWIAVVIVGALMMVYVLFGGMTATTWVQIIKACLLLAGATFMAFMVLYHFGFSPEAMFAKAVEVKTGIAAAAGKSPAEAAAQGFSIMGPGGFIKDPISAISFGMALMFGTAGLAAHPDALLHRAQREGGAQVGALGDDLDRLLLHPDLHHRLRRDHLRADQPAVPRRQGRPARRRQHGGDPPCQRGRRQRLPRLHLGRRVRDHPGRRRRTDLVRRVRGVARPLFDGDQEGQGRQRRRAEGLADHDRRLGIVAVVLGIAFEKQNIAFMVSLAFAIAASANFPVLLMSVLWKDCTTRGAVIGGFLGLVSSVLLTLVSPAVWEVTLGNPKGSALFPYASPALFSMTIGFVGIWLFSILDRSPRAAQDRAGFVAQQVRSETGIGASGASGH